MIYNHNEYWCYSKPENVFIMNNLIGKLCFRNTSTMDHNIFNTLMHQLPLNYVPPNHEVNQQIHCPHTTNLNCPPTKRLTSQSAEVITAEEHALSIKNTPAYFLELFIDSNIIQWLISETTSNINQLKQTQPSESEIRCFIAILYLSGYVDVPRRRMLWERAPDAHCPLVSNAMQRDRFEAIFTALNMADGLKDDSLKYLRLRPLFDKLNNRFLRFAPKDNQHSIAECSIAPNHKNVSVKVPQKMWCGCSKTGYCCWFDVCQPNDKLNRVFVGRSVILTYATLIQRFHLSNYSLVYENVYNEAQLVCELQRVGIQGSGAERDKSGCLLNPALGGVDRLDSNLSLYRSTVRGKKSYSALITYILDLALHNAWQLYKLTDDKKQLDLLGFRRNIVIYYLQHYAKPILGHRGGRPAKLRLRGNKRPAPSDARYDGIRHYVIPQEKQTRCAKCTAKTTTRCQKCDVGVHVKCFVDYHQRPKDNEQGTSGT